MDQFQFTFDVCGPVNKKREAKTKDGSRVFAWELTLARLGGEISVGVTQDIFNQVAEGQIVRIKGTLNQKNFRVYLNGDKLEKLDSEEAA